MITCIPGTLNEIPPQCFADDTNLLLRIPSQSDIDHWNFTWGVLTETTGLSLNPAKTQMLQLGDQCRIDLAPQIGVLTDQVVHLGVVQAVEDERGSELTYVNLIEKTIKSISLFLKPPPPLIFCTRACWFDLSLTPNFFTHSVYIHQTMHNLRTLII